ncbi:hypothetical protein [Roseateles sp. MS654]|uniref:hypothetical protein n=1 Tax=Roseateles sp. MS654 TaxID=3412685 RepID=UPI003C2C38A0
MERVDLPIHGLEAAPQEASPFHALLNQGSQPGAAPAPGQIVIGTLQAAPAQGTVGAAHVAGLGVVSVAHSLVPLTTAQEGQGVALSVLPGGAAIVLGLLWNGVETEPGTKLQQHETEAAHDGLVIIADGRRDVIEATEELELRCGEACIVLMADGRIQLRGTYITSHASATQRIVGGSVHVN